MVKWDKAPTYSMLLCSRINARSNPPSVPLVGFLSHGEAKYPANASEHSCSLFSTRHHFSEWTGNVFSFFFLSFIVIYLFFLIATSQRNITSCNPFRGPNQRYARDIQPWHELGKECMARSMASERSRKHVHTKKRLHQAAEMFQSFHTLLQGHGHGCPIWTKAGKRWNTLRCDICGHRTPVSREEKWYENVCYY